MGEQLLYLRVVGWYDGSRRARARDQRPGRLVQIILPTPSPSRNDLAARFLHPLGVSLVPFEHLAESEARIEPHAICWGRVGVDDTACADDAELHIKRACC